MHDTEGRYLPWSVRITKFVGRGCWGTETLFRAETVREDAGHGSAESETGRQIRWSHITLAKITTPSPLDGVETDHSAGRSGPHLHVHTHRCGFETGLVEVPSLSPDAAVVLGLLHLSNGAVVDLGCWLVLVAHHVPFCAHSNVAPLR